MPFGLCISPAYFQKFINIVFKELIASGTVVLYMDDLIVPSKDEKNGVERLEEVFKVASEYNLTLNWKKC